MKITKDYVFFWSGVFSQWYPCKFIIDGIEYNCAEQYMMAEKARIFQDYEIEKKILQEKFPKEQKNLGRQVKKFDVEIWVDKCELVVYNGNMAKFSQNQDLLEKLMNTGNRQLVEASPYDKIWGIGLVETDIRCLDETQWRGLNKLGNILVKVRSSMGVMDSTRIS